MYTEKENDDYFWVVLTRVTIDGDNSTGTGVDIDTGDVVEFRLRESVAQVFSERLKNKDPLDDRDPLIEIAWWHETRRVSATEAVR